MKLRTSYAKEMLIGLRGMYFYIEIFMAVVLLAILLLLVKPESDKTGQEFVYYTGNNLGLVRLLAAAEGIAIEQGAPKDFRLKQHRFTVNDVATDKQTETIDQPATDIRLDSLLVTEVGRPTKTIYLANSRQELLRLAYQTGDIGAIIESDGSGADYQYFIQGYETEKYKNLLLALHTKPVAALNQAMAEQSVRTIGQPIRRLNNREQLLPVFITFSGSLMGLFIVLAYLFLDKEEGVIKALMVSPLAIRTYLLSKILVIMTSVLISTTILVVPIMGMEANYLFLYFFLIITTFAFAAIGLYLASFFDNINQSFGSIYLLIVALMLPIFSYYIPGFDPVWLRFFPTYPVLYLFKQAIVNQVDIGYGLSMTGIYLLIGIGFMWASTIRYKKTFG